MGANSFRQITDLIKRIHKEQKNNGEQQPKNFCRNMIGSRECHSGADRGAEHSAEHSDEFYRFRLIARHKHLLRRIPRH